MKTDKLGYRSDKCLFVGYPKEIKKYYFYLTDEQKVFVSNRTVFLKKNFFKKRTNVSKIRSNLKSIIEISLRRFGRVLHQPDKYYDFLIHNGDPVQLNENNED